jgi:hypothetical protein
VNERESAAAPVQEDRPVRATRVEDAEFWLGELKHSGAAP